MPRGLSYTDEALADLASIRNWLTQPGSGRAATHRLVSIRASINRLRRHPCLYAIISNPGVRELPCAGGYLVMYEVSPDTSRNDTAGDVIVLRVFGPHQSRDLF